MRKLFVIFGASAVAALVPMYAGADNANVVVGVSGRSVPMCSATGLQNTIAIGDFTEVATGKIPTGNASKTLDLGTVTCSSDAYVSLKSANGHLKHEDATSCNTGDIINCVNYQADATWNEVTASIDTNTDGTTAKSSNGTAMSGSSTLTLDITIPFVNKVVQGGNYSDNITVQVGAQL